MSSENSVPELPRPFYGEGYSRSRQEVARVLWHWHSRLPQARAPALDGEDLAAYFQAEREKVVRGEPLKVVGRDVWEPAYDAVEKHDLQVALLAVQVEAARRFQEPMRFATFEELQHFIQQWAAPHGRLLAALGGLDKKWQRIHVDQLTLGLFLAGRLVEMPRDLERDRLFLPLEDLARAGLSEEQLFAGEVDDAVRGALWKLSVRARDALARSQELIHDLRWRQRGPFKRVWLGGLEVLGEIERRDFDVWSEPVELSFVNRLRIRLQSVFGKSAFGKR